MLEAIEQHKHVHVTKKSSKPAEPFHIQDMPSSPHWTKKRPQMITVQQHIAFATNCIKAIIAAVFVHLFTHKTFSSTLQMIKHQGYPVLGRTQCVHDEDKEKGSKGKNGKFEGKRNPTPPFPKQDKRKGESGKNKDKTKAIADVTPTAKTAAITMENVHRDGSSCMGSPNHHKEVRKYRFFFSHQSTAFIYLFYLTA